MGTKKSEAPESGQNQGHDQFYVRRVHHEAIQPYVVSVHIYIYMQYCIILYIYIYSIHVYVYVYIYIVYSTKIVTNKEEWFEQPVVPSGYTAFVKCSPACTRGF